MADYAGCYAMDGIVVMYFWTPLGDACIIFD